MEQYILLVDDDPDTRESMSELIDDLKYSTTSCDSGEAALEILPNKQFDLVLTDLQMPGMDGLALLGRIKLNYPDLPVVIITGYAAVDTAIEAIRGGAEDYLIKPCTQQELQHVLIKVLDRKQLIEENHRLQAELAEKYQIENIIGTSSSMVAVYALISKAAKSSANVVVLGDTGTGKELVAKAIHYSSARADEPLVSVNCTAIPENLIESELFGYVKGAFTGAIKDKQGLFESAGTGTIFLDEIGDLDLNLQAKLLRVLDQREFRRVGDTVSKKMEARIITATHYDLSEMVAAGKFREDLFYRLHVIPIFLPPLRKRKSDIPLLADHFLMKHKGAGSIRIDGFSDTAVKCLLGYEWPGNVREIENLIQRLIALAEKPVISHLDLPAQYRQFIQGSEADLSSIRSLKDAERDHIKRVVEIAPNKTKAAKLLGINRTTLYEKLKRYKIT